MSTSPEMHGRHDAGVPPVTDRSGLLGADRGVPGTTHTPGVGGTDDRSLGDLISEVTQDLSTLMRQEVELAKAEATQTAKNAGKGAGMLGGAAYSGGMVLLFLSIALWWALGTAIGFGWSALVVAVLWAVVAAVLAVLGRKEIQRAPGLDRTTDSLKKIPHALQGHEEKNR